MNLMCLLNKSLIIKLYYLRDFYIDGRLINKISAANNLAEKREETTIRKAFKHRIYLLLSAVVSGEIFETMKS